MSQNLISILPLIGYLFVSLFHEIDGGFCLGLGFVGCFFFNIYIHIFFLTKINLGIFFFNNNFFP